MLHWRCNTRGRKIMNDISIECLSSGFATESLQLFALSGFDVASVPGIALPFWLLAYVHQKHWVRNCVERAIVTSEKKLSKLPNWTYHKSLIGPARGYISIRRHPSGYSRDFGLFQRLRPLATTRNKFNHFPLRLKEKHTANRSLTTANHAFPTNIHLPRRRER